MRSQVLTSTRRLLSQPSSLRLPATPTAIRSISTIRSTPSASSQHTSQCRCLSCSRTFTPSSSLLSSRLHSTRTATTSHSRSFSSDSHGHHGDFLDAHDIEARILTILRGIDKLSSANITAQATFSELGLDSLDEVEVVMQIEEEFMIDLYDPIANGITSVPQAVKIISETPFAM